MMLIKNPFLHSLTHCHQNSFQTCFLFKYLKQDYSNQYSVICWALWFKYKIEGFLQNPWFDAVMNVCVVSHQDFNMRPIYSSLDELLWVWVVGKNSPLWIDLEKWSNESMRLCNPTHCLYICQRILVWHEVTRSGSNTSIRFLFSSSKNRPQNCEKSASKWMNIEKEQDKRNSPAGNRTRVASVTGMNSTTKPQETLFNFTCCTFTMISYLTQTPPTRLNLAIYSTCKLCK
jgi:hypothetical protein